MNKKNIIVVFESPLNNKWDLDVDHLNILLPYNVPNDYSAHQIAGTNLCNGTTV